jgi:hypothetical protein
MQHRSWGLIARVMSMRHTRQHLAIPKYRHAVIWNCGNWITETQGKSERTKTLGLSDRLITRLMLLYRMPRGWYLQFEGIIEADKTSDLVGISSAHAISRA